jgi:hypothetical protein
VAIALASGPLDVTKGAQILSIRTTNLHRQHSCRDSRVPYPALRRCPDIIELVRIDLENPGNFNKNVRFIARQLRGSASDSPSSEGHQGLSGGVVARGSLDTG